MPQRCGEKVGIGTLLDALEPAVVEKGGQGQARQAEALQRLIE